MSTTPDYSPQLEANIQKWSNIFQTLGARPSHLFEPNPMISNSSVLSIQKYSNTLFLRCEMTRMVCNKSNRSSLDVPPVSDGTGAGFINLGIACHYNRCMGQYVTTKPVKPLRLLNIQHMTEHKQTLLNLIWNQPMHSVVQSKSYFLSPFSSLMKWHRPHDKNCPRYNFS